jgi:hypothetical protein
MDTTYVYDMDTSTSTEGREDATDARGLKPEVTKVCKMRWKKSW